MTKWTSRIVITAVMTTVAGIGLSMTEASVAFAASANYGCQILNGSVDGLVSGNMCAGSGIGPGTVSGSGKRYTCAYLAGVPMIPFTSYPLIVIGTGCSPS
jgi:hypothetical protein